MKKLSVFVSFLFLMNLANAASPVGEVVKLKGKVTALFPGQREAVELKEGMNVIEDTSVLSEPGSFAQIKMNDGSRVVLGPKSKMVINYIKKETGGVISLMKGKIRSQVKKEESGRTKLLVKTRSAAMGVRGTDFQAVYNPQSDMTSLVTYTGKVAMVKVERADNEMKDIVKKENRGKVSLDKIFEKKKPVFVEKGNYSAVSSNLEKATAPVNLNPVQFSILKLNKDFVTKKSEIPQEKIEKEIKEIKKVLHDRSKKNPKMAKAQFDIKTGEYKPKEGGLIDLETGIYIPPSKESKFNKELNIFEEKNVEEKITDSGDYNPPKGVVLDAVKGFVPTSKEAKEKVSQMNQDIAGQIVKPKKPSFDELKGEDSNSYEKYFKIED